MKNKLLLLLLSIMLGFSAANAQSVLLQDNGDFVTHPGEGFNGADVSDAGKKAHGLQVAKPKSNWACDDFTIAEGEFYKIDSVVFAVGLNGNSEIEYSPIDELYLVVLDSSPVYAENPQVLYGSKTKDVYYDSRFSGVYRIRSEENELTDNNMPIHYVVWKPESFVVSEGTYWMEYSFGKSGGEIGLPVMPFANYRKDVNNGGHYKPESGWRPFFNWKATSDPYNNDWSWETAPLKVWGSVANNDIPTVATNLSTEINGNELSAIVKWTNPAVNIAGETLGSLTKVEIYVDNNEEPAATVTEGLVVGEAAQAVVPVSTVGFHTFTLICYNDNGISLKASVEGWAGNPDPILEYSIDTLDFGMIPVGMGNKTLNFKITNKGYNSCKIDSIIDPTLNVFSENNDISALKFGYNESVTLSVSCRPAIADETYFDSIQIVTRTQTDVLYLKAQSREKPDYYFDNVSDLDNYPPEWSVFGDEPFPFTWFCISEYFTNVKNKKSLISIKYHPDTDGNLLVTQKVMPTPNNNKLEFSYTGSGTGKLVVLVSETTRLRDSFNIVATFNDITGDGWQNAVVDLSAYEYKPIYIGFLNKSKLSQNSVIIDNMYGPFRAGAPGLVSEIKTTPVSTDRLTMNLEWLNPTKNHVNDSLFQLTEIEIYLDNKLDEPYLVVDATEMGATQSTEITLEQGNHQLNIVAVNEFGSSEYAELNVYAGVPYTTLVDSSQIINKTGAGIYGSDLSATHPGQKTVAYLARRRLNEQIADDIIIPEGEAWELKELTYYVAQGMSDKYKADVRFTRIRIWNGTPEADGSKLVYDNKENEEIFSCYHTGVYRTPYNQLTESWRSIMEVNVKMDRLVLTEGTYWISLSVGGVSLPMIIPISKVDQPATGNALHYTEGEWGLMADAATGDQQGIAWKFSGNKIDMSCANALSGVVSDSEGPIANVKITAQMADTNINMYATTDSLGKYSIPAIPCGDYTIEALLFGYYENNVSATISENNSTEQNITLTLVPEFEVKGSFIDLDGAPVEGVKVKLSGYSEYVTKTNSSGAYVFDKVYKSDELYSLLATKELYNDVTADVLVDGNIDLGEQNIVEIPKKPIGVVATPTDTSAIIKWLTPDKANIYSTQFAKVPENFVYDTNFFTIKYNKLTFKTANRAGKYGAYWNGEVADFDIEMEVFSNQVSNKTDFGFFLRADTSITNANKTKCNGYLVLYSPYGGVEFGKYRNGQYQSLSGFVITDKVNPNKNVVRVTANGDEFSIYANGELIGTISDTEYSAGKNGLFFENNYSLIYDVNYLSLKINQKTVADYQKKSKSKAAINTFAEPAYASAAEFLEAGNVEVNNKEFNPTFSTLSNFKGGTSKGLKKYNIYRMAVDSVLYPETWTVIPHQVTSTLVVDDEWPLEKEGFYMYGVETMYSGNSVSEISVSNQIAEGEYFDLKLVVNTNIGASAHQGVVQINHTELPGFYSRKVVWKEGYTPFTRLYKGTYWVRINKPGYDYYFDTLNILSDTVITVTLTETLEKPYGIKLVGDTLSWNGALADLFIDFEEGYMPRGVKNWRITNKGVNPQYGYPNTWHVNQLFYNQPDGSQVGPDGRYALSLLPSFGTNQDEIAVLKPIHVTANTKLKFKLVNWVNHVNGKDDDLKISARPVGYSHIPTMYWSIAEPDGLFNETFEFNLGSIKGYYPDTEAFEVIFWATASKGLDKPIYIDNIEIYEEKTDMPSPKSGAKAPVQYTVLMDDLELGTVSQKKIALDGVDYGEHEFAIKAIYANGESDYAYKTFNYQKRHNVVVKVMKEDGKPFFANQSILIDGNLGGSNSKGIGMVFDVTEGKQPLAIYADWMEKRFIPIFDTIDVQEGMDTLRYTIRYFNPEANVSPKSIEAVVDPGSTGTESLTISNENNGNMEYAVYTDYIASSKKSATYKSVSAFETTDFISDKDIARPTISDYTLTPMQVESKGDVEGLQLHHDGKPEAAFGLYIADYICATLFTGDDLTEAAGKYLTSVDFAISFMPFSGFKVLIYAGSNTDGPAELVHEQDITWAVENSWNRVYLDEPILLTDDDLWIGITADNLHQRKFMMMDLQPSDGKGQIISIDGYWFTLSQVYGQQIDANFNIRGNVKGYDNSWISFTNPKGFVKGGESTDIGVNIDATNLELGDYSANVIVYNDDEPYIIPVTLSVVTSIASNEKFGVAVYPNPATTHFNVKCDKAVDNIRIYNVSGSLVYTSEDNGVNPTFNMSDFENGYYFVELDIEGVTVKQKLIKN